MTMQIYVKMFVTAVLCCFIFSQVICSPVECPDGCRCGFNGMTLNCASNGTYHQSKVPATLPERAVQLILDNNWIDVIQQGDFPKTKASLVYLSIQRNKINVIQANAFKYLKHLQSLLLFNNLIKTPTIKTYVGLTSLKLLHLGRNSILEIPCKAFKDMTMLENLKLGQNQLIEVTSCMFQGLVNIKQLDLSNNRITNIDKNAFTDLVKLTDLSINNNYISKIHSDWFASKRLNQVRVSGNPWNCNCNLFSQYAKIKTMISGPSCLYDNMCVRCHMPTTLQTTPIEAVNNSHWATCLSPGIDLDQDTNNNSVSCNSNGTNCSVKLSAPGVKLNNTVPQTVLYLNLTSNSISHINITTFSGLSNLLGLELSTSNITSIEDNAFEDQQQLLTMDLSSNELSEIGHGIFFGLTNLELLNLKDNNITGAINNQTFQHLNSLSILDLGENDLKEILECAFCNTTLQQLFLDKNSISYIHRSAFKGLSDLEVLSIASNRLTQLDFTQFVGMSALVTLRTSNNKWKCTCKMKIELTRMIANIYKSVSCERDYFCIQCSSPETLKGSFLHTVLQNNCTTNSTFAVTPTLSYTTSGVTAMPYFCKFFLFVVIILNAVFYC